MPLEQLLGALDRDARTMSEQLLGAAQAEADRITASGAAELDARRDRAARAHDAEQAAALELVLADARREARALMLDARERLLARIRAAAIAALPAALESAEYRASLESRVARALECVDDTAPLVLQAPPGLIPLLRSLVANRANVAVEAVAGADSGFRLLAPNGAIEVDDTLETRLASADLDLMRQALDALGLGL